VIGEERANIRRATDVEVWLEIGVLENVDESRVLRHHRTEGIEDADP
jgi:hypothetical protein